MPWFVKGEDVQRLYRDRIEGFFQRMQIPSPLHVWTTDPLEKLFDWAKNLQRDNIRLQQEHHEATQESRSLRRQMDQRIKELKDTRDSLHRMTSDNKKYEHDLQELSNKYNHDMDALLIQHDEVTESMKREHRKEVQTLVNRYENELKIQKRKASTDIHNKNLELENYRAQFKKELEERTNKHNAEFDKLLGQVLTNTDDSAEWPDDKLKVNFGELKRLADSITSPRRREFTLPSKDVVGQDLDPTGFVHRGYSHLLLKNAIWSVLVEQFFAIPFGFGAFGPGKGQDELFTMFGSWRKLFDSNVSPTPDPSTLKVFEHDRQANKWRSSTFQGISTVKPLSNSPLARLRKDNIDLTTARILGFLSEFAKLCNGVVSEEVENEIGQLVEQSFELAVQFGVQPARLHLLFPERGEVITIGPDYHETQDGDEAKGSSFEVDLVTAGGLQKVGDGRSDMVTKRAIFPCQVWTLKT
jgi:hypothetical protein